MISSIAEKLRDPEYRRAFVASQMNVGIPFQIRALLKARGRTQDWLAKKTGMLQPRISGLISPGKTRPNVETLRRVADAFDCGLAVRFVPFTELAEWSEKFDPESFNVPDFNAEMALLQSKQVIAPLQEQAQGAPDLVAPGPFVTRFLAGTHAVGAGAGGYSFPTGSVAALTGSGTAAGVLELKAIVEFRSATNGSEHQPTSNPIAAGGNQSPWPEVMSCQIQ